MESSGSVGGTWISHACILAISLTSFCHCRLSGLLRIVVHLGCGHCDTSNCCDTCICISSGWRRAMAACSAAYRV
ncbi:hypothetical protein Micbo1qcDRAFT_168592, partial [Microdochium bolleyi]